MSEPADPPASEDEFALADYGDTLRAVVLGEKFPEWQIAGAKQVCDAANVELRQMVWWNGRPITVQAKTPED
jgi:hypothetical protein